MMKNAFRKKSTQLHINDSGELVETSFREHFGTFTAVHRTLCKCAIRNTFSACRGKTTCYISRCIFHCLHANLSCMHFKYMHVKWRTVPQSFIYCFSLGLDYNSHLDSMWIVSKIKGNIPSEICRLLILLLSASAYLDKGQRGV